MFDILGITTNIQSTVLPIKNSFTVHLILVKFAKILPLVRINESSISLNCVLANFTFVDVTVNKLDSAVGLFFTSSEKSFVLSAIWQNFKPKAML